MTTTKIPATLSNPGSHLPLPSMGRYPADLLYLGLGMAPGGINTCYPECRECSQEPLDWPKQLDDGLFGGCVAVRYFSDGGYVRVNVTDPPHRDPGGSEETTEVRRRHA